MNLQLVIFAILFSNFVKAQEMISLPSKDERGSLFQAVVDEINRLDGEGLPVRGNRPESWEVTTAKLKEEVKAAFTAKIPMARFGNAAEVAEATAFLLSDHASYITGETLKVNGGMYM